MGWRPHISWFPLPALEEIWHKHASPQLLVNATIPKCGDEGQERPNSQGFHWLASAFFLQVLIHRSCHQGCLRYCHSLKGEWPEVRNHLKVLAKTRAKHSHYRRLQNGRVPSIERRERVHMRVGAYVCTALGGCLENIKTWDSILMSCLHHPRLRCQGTSPHNAITHWHSPRSVLTPSCDSDGCCSSHLPQRSFLQPQDRQYFPEKHYKYNQRIRLPSHTWQKNASELLGSKVWGGTLEGNLLAN